MVLTRLFVSFFVLLVPFTLAAGGGDGKFNKHYQHSLFKVTDNGRYSVEAVVKEQDLRAGENGFDLIVHDDQNRDVVGAEVRVTPRMTGMDHAISKKPVVTEKGGGLYRVENVVLGAGGHWELRVTVKKDAVEDATAFVLSAMPAGGHGHEHHTHGHGMHHQTGMRVNAEKNVIDVSMAHQTPNFQVAYTSDAMPIPVNKFHTWKLKVATPDGKPVTGATITIDGDMPTHGHGLPTKPEVTREIADGVYLIEGLKFSMPGHWVVKFHVAANGKQNTAAFNLVLK